MLMLPAMSGSVALAGQHRVGEKARGYRLLPVRALVLVCKYILITSNLNYGMRRRQRNGDTPVEGGEFALFQGTCR